MEKSVELEWVCKECGHSFNPTECGLVWNIGMATAQVSVIIYCPNSKCGKPWIDVCHKLRERN